MLRGRRTSHPLTAESTVQASTRRGHPGEEQEVLSLVTCTGPDVTHQWQPGPSPHAAGLRRRRTITNRTFCDYAEALQGGVVLDTAESCSNGAGQLVEGEGSEVGQGGALEVGPDLLDGVEVGGVGGQVVDRCAGSPSGCRHTGRDCCTAWCRAAAPRARQRRQDFGSTSATPGSSRPRCPRSAPPRPGSPRPAPSDRRSTTARSHPQPPARPASVPPGGWTGQRTCR